MILIRIGDKIVFNPEQITTIEPRYELEEVRVPVKLFGIVLFHTTKTEFVKQSEDCLIRFSDRSEITIRKFTMEEVCETLKKEWALSLSIIELQER